MDSAQNARPSIVVFAGVVLGVVGVPLAMLPGGYNEFGPLKAVALALAGLLVAVGLAVDGRAAGELLVAMKRSRLAWACLVALGLASLATATALEPRVSFLGNYPDYRGLLGIAAAVAIGAGAAAIAVRRGEASWLYHVAVVGALGVSVVGVFERAWVSFDQLEHNFVRVSSTLGNSSNLGVYLVLALPLCAGVLLNTGDRRAWRAAAAVAVGLGLVTLVWTSSRGAWLGLVAALLAGVVVLAAKRRGRQLLLVIAALAAVVVLLGAVVLLTPKAASRLSSLADASSRSSQVRLSMWRSSVRMVADRPLLGFGPNSFVAAFPPYRERGQEDGAEGYRVTESAHNLFADAGTSAGVPGVLALVAIIAASGVAVARWTRSQEDALGPAAVAGALAGSLVALQFHYVTMDTGPLIASLVGVLVAAETQTRAPAPGVAELAPSGTAGTVAVRVGLGVVALVCLGFAVLSVGVLRADRALSQSVARLDSGEPWANVAPELERAVALASIDPFAKRVVLQLATTRLEKGNDASAARKGSSIAQQLIDSGSADPTVWYDVGRFYFVLYRADRSPARLKKAADAVAQAIALDPNGGMPMVAAGEILLEEDRPGEAVRTINRGLWAVPRSSRAWRLLAKAYREIGNDEQAAYAVKRARLYEQR